MATRAEAASRLGVDVRTIGRMVRDGELHATKGDDGQWVIDDDHLTQKENALLDKVADLPAVRSTLDVQQADLLEGQAKLLASVTRTIELLQRPLEVLTGGMQRLLDRALDREEKLQAQLQKGFETVQMALDRSSDRELAHNAAVSRDRRMGEAFDWIREQLPIALKYGVLQKALPKVAPFILGMFESEADWKQAEENLDPEALEGLREIVGFMRAEQAKKAAEQAQRDREAAKQNTETPAEPENTEAP